MGKLDALQESQILLLSDPSLVRGVSPADREAMAARQ